VRKHRQVLSALEWTAIVLDEGQKIRNPQADITQTCKLFPAYHRIILSGTPIQNSLQELWSLMDFIYPGRLGSLPVFDIEFATPIRLGAYGNATKLQVELAIRCAISLQQIVAPFLLRRKKSDYAVIAQLPPKTEHILFCQLSPKQMALYDSFLDSEEVAQVLRRKVAAFAAINTLRKLCNHPVLFESTAKESVQSGLKASKQAQQQQQQQQKTKKAHRQHAVLMDEVEEEDEVEKEEGEEEDVNDRVLERLLRQSSTTSATCPPIQWADSGKLFVLSKILPVWKAEGHKVLLFCQTLSMLSLIESMVLNMNLTYRRLDGTTPVNKRPHLIHEFNTNPAIYLMLLTTRTGGVGISLTAANRVILYDPDWNPMTDMQARERAWRLGQVREVTIYRLVTKGTIEEKIYQRQIYKLLLSTRVLENAKQTAKSMFSKSQLKELFTPDYHNNNNTNNDANANDGNDDDHVIEEKEMILDLPRAGTVSLSSHNNTTTSTTDTNVNTNSADSDKMILKALFEGEALAGVYDHAYLDPSNPRPNPPNHSLEDYARKHALQAKVNQVVATVQASAKHYYQPLPAAETPIATTATALVGSVSTRHHTSTEGMMGTSGTGMMNSATLLARLKSSSSSSSSSSTANMMPPPPAVIPAVKQPTTTPFSSPLLLSSSSSSSSSSSATATTTTGTGLSIQDSITQRLLTLFHTSPPPHQLPTTTLLAAFPDLGDQYAPLFRQTLRSLATTNNSLWTLKLQHTQTHS